MAEAAAAAVEAWYLAAGAAEWEAAYAFLQAYQAITAIQTVAPMFNLRGPAALGGAA